MRNAARSLSIGIVLTCLLSCDTSFNPSAPFQSRMVVYSVLTTESDTQYVRIYTSYNPPDNDPTKHSGEVTVGDAQVTMAEEGGPTFSFDAFALPQLPTWTGLDESRSLSGEVAYASAFRPSKGKTYVLTVNSASLGTVTAKTTVPGAGSVNIINPAALANPCFYGQDFGLSAVLSPQAKGFLVRLFVDYLSPNIDGSYKQKRLEVPMRREMVSGWQGSFREVYPRPTVRSTHATAAVYDGDTLIYQPEERVPYNSFTFCQKVDDLYTSGLEGCVHFQKAVLYLVQFDTPLWNYYKVAGATQDRYSVRADEPDYTNIKDGVGVFGSMAVDSLVWPYIPRIIPYHVPRATVGCQ